MQGNKPDNWWIGRQPGAVTKVDGRWVVNELAENIRNLPDAYYDNLRQGKAENWIRANLGNELVYVTDGRPVHPAFNESVHVRHCGPHPGRRYTLGWIGAERPQRPFAASMLMAHGRCSMSW